MICRLFGSVLSYHILNLKMAKILIQKETQIIDACQRHQTHTWSVISSHSVRAHSRGVWFLTHMNHMVLCYPLALIKVTCVHHRLPGSDKVFVTFK